MRSQCLLCLGCLTLGKFLQLSLRGGVQFGQFALLLVGQCLTRLLSLLDGGLLEAGGGDSQLVLTVPALLDQLP